MGSLAGAISTFAEEVAVKLAHLDPWTCVFAIATWIFLSGVRAIIGEHAKRFYFRRTWRDAVEKANHSLNELNKAVTLERAVHAETVQIAEQAIRERDIMILERIRDRVEINELRQKVASATADQSILESMDA